MTRPMSRKERKAAFMEKAEEMFAELEEWYDQNPEASFEEVEGQARKARRKMMGSALSLNFAPFQLNRETKKHQCHRQNIANRAKR